MSYPAFARWLRETEAADRKTPAEKKRKPGRSKTDAVIRDLVVGLVKENSWGYPRIMGEL